MPGWIYVTGMLGTWVIAIAAIWGERIRAAVLRADLRLELLSSDGEFTTQIVGGGGTATIIPARYFHLRVTNRHRFPAAREVEVFITKLEKRGPDGRPQLVYSVELPLAWRFADLRSVTARTIGRPTKADADLFFVTPQALTLLPRVLPNNFTATMQGETHIWITAAALGTDATSKELRLRIDWDGQWERGDAEMSRHLVVSVEKN